MAQYQEFHAESAYIFVTIQAHKHHGGIVSGVERMAYIDQYASFRNAADMEHLPDCGNDIRWKQQAYNLFLNNTLVKLGLVEVEGKAGVSMLTDLGWKLANYEHCQVLVEMWIEQPSHRKDWGFFTNMLATETVTVSGTPRTLEQVKQSIRAAKDVVWQLLGHDSLKALGTKHGNATVRADINSLTYGQFVKKYNIDK
jgi:hypothetical protein